jgi:ABC-type glycerol-3-phosphate transport system permease component
MKLEPYKIGIYFILIILSVVWLFPLVSILTMVVKSPDEFNTLGYWKLPPLRNMAGNILSNFGHAWVRSKLGGNMLNSLIFALSVTSFPFRCS